MIFTGSSRDLHEIPLGVALAMREAMREARCDGDAISVIFLAGRAGNYQWIFWGYQWIFPGTW